MRIFIFLFTSLFIAIGSFAQSEGEMKKSGNYLVPVEYLDPNYPDIDEAIQSGLSVEQAILNLRIYSKNLGRFPEYISTGNPELDNENYRKACAKFFENHPYFPQEIYTGNSKKDAENFDRWYKAWIEFYPIKATKVQRIEEGGAK